MTDTLGKIKQKIDILQTRSFEKFYSDPMGGLSKAYFCNQNIFSINPVFKPSITLLRDKHIYR